jgi:hypothetical protein
MCFMGGLGVCVYIWLWMDQAVSVCVSLSLRVSPCPCQQSLVVLLLLLLLLCVDGGLAVQWEAGDVQWSPGRWAGLSLAAPRQQRAVQASTSPPASQTRDMAERQPRQRVAEQHVGCSRWCDNRRPLSRDTAPAQRCSGEAQPGGRRDPVPSEPMRLPGPLKQRAGPRQPQRMADGNNRQHAMNRLERERQLADGSGTCSAPTCTACTRLHRLHRR